MSLTLPKSVREKIAAMPETSHGANRVTLILKGDRRVSDVVVAWATEVVQVGNVIVKEESDLGFALQEVVDVVA